MIYGPPKKEKSRAQILPQLLLNLGLGASNSAFPTLPFLISKSEKILLNEIRIPNSLFNAWHMIRSFLPPGLPFLIPTEL